MLQGNLSLCAKMTEACVRQLSKPVCPRASALKQATEWEAHASQWSIAHAQQQRPNTVKNKQG